MSGANYTRVWQIHAVLHPRPDDLISTSRFFVREGELYVWNEKKRKKQLRYFFLFNDILLLTNRESHKRYWLRIHITLRSPYVSVEDIDNSSYNQEIRLHCRSRSFILYAPSDELRRDWIEDLRASIAGTHKDELDGKEAKKKGEDVIAQKNEQTGKVVAPTLSKVGKKPPRDDDDDDGSDERPVRRQSKSRRGRDANAAPQFLNDIIEYPSQPGMDAVRPGGAYVQSSPGAFNLNSGGNPFLSSGPGQPPNPFAPQNNQFLALTMSSNNSTFGQPAPASNPFAPQAAANPFAVATTTQSPFFSQPGTQAGAANPFAPQPTFGSTNSFASQPVNPFAPQAQPQQANPFF